MYDRELPAGPGVGVRWAGAVPLIVLALIGPAFVAAAASAWRQHLSSLASSRQFRLTDRELVSFADSFAEQLPAMLSMTALYVVIGLVLVVLCHRASTTWAMIMFWCALPAGFVTGMSALAFEMNGPDTVLFVGAGLASMLASWGLGKLAALVLTRPVARDLVDSDLEIPLPLHGSTARLRVQHDRLLIDRLESAGRAQWGRTAIAWSNLRSVQVGSVAEDLAWPMPSGVDLVVPAGTVVRIVAAEQHWVVPLATRADAALATTVILARAAQLRDQQHYTGEEAERVRGIAVEHAAKTLTKRQRRESSQSPIGGAIFGVLVLVMAVAAFASMIPPLTGLIGMSPQTPISGMLGTVFFGAVGTGIMFMYRKSARDHRLFEAIPGKPAAELDPALWTEITPAVER